MERSEAAETLETVQRVRAETRRRLDTSWFPRLVLGAFFVGAAVVALAEATSAVAGAYWIGGLALATVAIVVRATRTERRRGLEARAWDGSMTLLVATVLAVVGANQLSDGGTDTSVAVMAVAALSTAGFAWLARDPIIAVSAGVMALLAIVYGLAGVDEPGIWVNGGIGVIVAASGIAGLVHDRSQLPHSYRSGAARA